MLWQVIIFRINMHIHIHFLLRLSSSHPLPPPLHPSRFSPTLPWNVPQSMKDPSTYFPLTEWHRDVGVFDRVPSGCRTPLTNPHTTHPSPHNHSVGCLSWDDNGEEKVYCGEWQVWGPEGAGGRVGEGDHNSTSGKVSAARVEVGGGVVGAFNWKEASAASQQGSWKEQVGLVFLLASLQKAAAVQVWSETGLPLLSVE